MLQKLFSRRVQSSHETAGLLEGAVRNAVLHAAQHETVGPADQPFRLLADTLPALVWMSGPQKEGIYFNKAWLEFTGRTMEQESGAGWLECIHPDDMNTGVKVCIDAFKVRAPFRTQFRMRRHDGEYRWFLDAAEPRFSRMTHTAA